MTVRLEELLAASTPGPWKALIEDGWVEGIEMGEDDFIQTDGGHYGPNVHNAALIALVPDAYRLLIDMGEALRNCHHDFDPAKDECSVCSPLLARLDRLGNTT